MLPPGELKKKVRRHGAGRPWRRVVGTGSAFPWPPSPAGNTLHEVAIKYVTRGGEFLKMSLQVVKLSVKEIVIVGHKQRIFNTHLVLRICDKVEA